MMKRMIYRVKYGTAYSLKYRMTMKRERTI